MNAKMYFMRIEIDLIISNIIVFNQPGYISI